MKIISRPSPTWSKMKKTPTSQPTWNPSLREPAWNSPSSNCASKTYLRTTSITDGRGKALNLRGSSPPSPWGTTLLTCHSTLPQCSLSTLAPTLTPITPTSSRNTISSSSSMGRGSWNSVSKRRSESKREGRRVRRRLIRRRRKKRRRRALRNDCYIIKIYRINPLFNLFSSK